MAKRAQKQGKKANKNTGKKVAQVAPAPKSPIIDDEDVEFTPESPIIDDEASKEAEKSARAAEKEAAKAARAAEKASAKADEKTPAKAAKAQAKPQKKEQPKAAKSAKQPPKKPSVFRRILTYFKNVRLEIKRTTWPSRNEVLRMSLIVVGALIFFGVFIFIMDWVMTKLLELYATFVPASSGFPLLMGIDVPLDPSVK